MFTYTQSWTNLDSSLVKGIYHDADKRQMLVKLNGDKQYIYPNVTENDAASLAASGSVGRAYNSFRAYRGRGNGGSRAHGEIVAPKEQVRTPQASTSFKPVNSISVASGGVRSSYEVTFVVDGKSHTTTVEASSLPAAVADVSAKLNVFGTLRPVLTGVVRKS